MAGGACLMPEPADAAACVGSSGRSRKDPGRLAGRKGNSRRARCARDRAGSNGGVRIGGQGVGKYAEGRWVAADGRGPAGLGRREPILAKASVHQPRQCKHGQKRLRSLNRHVHVGYVPMSPEDDPQEGSTLHRGTFGSHARHGDNFVPGWHTKEANAVPPVRSRVGLKAVCEISHLDPRSFAPPVQGIVPVDPSVCQQHRGAHGGLSVEAGAVAPVLGYEDVTGPQVLKPDGQEGQGRKGGLARQRQRGEESEDDEGRSKRRHQGFRDRSG